VDHLRVFGTIRVNYRIGEAMDVDDNVRASVIIVGHNGRKYLEGCLSSVLDQDMEADEFEILFVDNNSADGSVQLVEEKFPSVKVIELSDNLGFYVACNKAVRYARGRYLVMLPQDTIAHRRWLPELVKAAEDDDRTMICVANAIGPDSPDYEARDRVGGARHIHFPEMSRFGFVRSTIMPFAEERICTLACAGVSALIKRAVVSKIGYLFDPLVGHYVGDMEVGLRISVMGYRIVYVPTAVIYHVGEEAKSLKDLRLLLRYAIGSRDRILMYYKNMTNPEFLLFMPIVTLGVSLKSLELRVSPIQRAALLLVSLVLCPLVLLGAVLQLAEFSSVREDVLLKRKVDRFWLLRNIWNGGQDLDAGWGRSRIGRLGESRL